MSNKYKWEKPEGHYHKDQYLLFNDIEIRIFMNNDEYKTKLKWVIFSYTCNKIHELFHSLNSSEELFTLNELKLKVEKFLDKLDTISIFI